MSGSGRLRRIFALDFANLVNLNTGIRLQQNVAFQERGNVAAGKLRRLLACN